MSHRRFGFTASSPPPCDEDREGAAGALPAAEQPRLKPRGHPSAAARYVLEPVEEKPRREPLWITTRADDLPSARVVQCEREIFWGPAHQQPKRHDLTAVIAALVLLGLIAVSLAGSCRFGLFGLCRDHSVHVWTREHVIT